MINTNNQVGADPLASNVAPAVDETAAATAASDFQSFLQLLTAQMRNQDPLSPIDSTQFVEQLASFSSVEQQIETNKKLDALTEGLAGSELETVTQFIGKDVEVANSVAQFKGEPLTYGVPSSNLGEVQREFVVTDAGGNTVYTAPIANSARDFTWDGKTSDGKTAAIGDYSVSVNFVADGAVAETKPPLAQARVTEARFTGEAVQLILSNGAAINQSDILAIKEPKPAATDA